MSQTTKREFDEKERTRISAELNKSLGPEWISHRSGPGGRVSYIEGQAAIQIANDIFGFNGWSSEIRNCTVDYLEMQEGGRVNLGVSVIVRVTLKDGTYHEDIGYGQMQNALNRAAALEKAKKEATTDALKRALRMFGNVLGNCLYDKAFLSNVSRMKTPTVAFDPKNLYRHPQFANKDNSPDAKPSAAAVGSTTTGQALPSPGLSTPTAVMKPEPSAASVGPTTGQALPAPSSSTTTAVRKLDPPSPLKRQKIGPAPTKESSRSSPFARPASPMIANSDDASRPLTVSALPPGTPNRNLSQRSSGYQDSLSYSYEGDDTLFAELAEQEYFFDKPDLELQTSDMALNFSWSTSGTKQQQQQCPTKNNAGRKRKTSENS